MSRHSTAHYLLEGLVDLDVEYMLEPVYSPTSAEISGGAPSNANGLRN
jgi:hypothetical protein